MRFGLRWQILIGLTALMVGTVLLVSLAVLAVTWNGMEAQARSTAERVAAVAAATMASALDPEEPLTGPSNLEDLARLCALFAGPFDGARMAVVASPRSGAPLATVAAYPSTTAAAAADVELLVARAARQSLSRISTTADGVRQVDVFVPVVLNGEVVAVVRLEIPLGDAQRVLSAAQQLLVLYLALNALLLVVLGFLGLTYLVVRPIATISAATERVAAGDLDGTVAVASRNEIGDLARNFEAMVARLRGGRDALELRVSELAAANAALAQAQSELVVSEKLATLGALAAGVAHEIGNPLAAVIGLLDLVRDREQMEDEEVGDLLKRIDREVSRINGIITELLDYARLEASESEAVDILAPLRTAASLAAHHPRGKRIDLVVPDGPGPRVVASENGLVQVFLNLLLNAADAGGGRARVEVELRQAEMGGEPGLWLDFSDDGQGIPDAVLPRIFEPFVTTKPAGVGTGLGLAMAQRIIDQHRGRIEASNLDGGGAQFRIWLPLAEG